ncbi:uncharacterized protein [Narcine bancroftii]|uniref:uncharacterized protein isoform X2 n=1 Tax=Narcine bancroftii TaxID=1343680 RepID=UPI003831257C
MGKRQVSGDELIIKSVMISLNGGTGLDGPNGRLLLFLVFSPHSPRTLLPHPYSGGDLHQPISPLTGTLPACRRNLEILEKNAMWGTERMCKVHIDRMEPPVCLRMECPVCGQDFPRSVIENHAWNCSGDTGPSEGSGQYQEAGENLECPLCFLSLPPDLIVEHAAFCKGPSCADLPEQGYCSPDKPQEQLTPCFSQEDRKDDSSQIASCITWAFHNYINTKRSEDQRTATCSVEPWSNELKSSDKENVNQLLQCIQKIAVQIDQEPKFNDLLCTLLKSSDPLGILKHLMKEIFKKFQNGSPLALFFILAKLFLPRIVELKSLTVFMKWLEGFICNVVVPWIINEGGWRSPNAYHQTSHVSPGASANSDVVHD